MSVVASKRSEGKLLVLTKANELAVYTIRICSNERNFPKHYRWCITAKIVDAAMDISNYANMANSVYVDKPEDYAIRRQYQTRAMAATYSLLNMIDIAYRTFGIEHDRIEYWTRLVNNVQNLLRNWRRGDAERYENMG